MNGAEVDPSEFIQPWTTLFLNFYMENSSDEEKEGSFKPLNIGFGWITNENKKNNKEEACYQNQ